jgi:hypothetical protein
MRNVMLFRVLRNKRKSFFSFLALGLLFLTMTNGCGSKGGQPDRLYEGEMLQKEQVAVFKYEGHKSFLQNDPAPFIYKVDGIAKEGSLFYNSPWNHTFTLELLPGTHKILFGFVSGNLHSAVKKVATFEAIAGHEYTMVIDLDTKNETFSGRIVDLASGKIVTESP